MHAHAHTHTHTYTHGCQCVFLRSVLGPLPLTWTLRGKWGPVEILLFVIIIIIDNPTHTIGRAYNRHNNIRYFEL